MKWAEVQLISIMGLDASVEVGFVGVGPKRNGGLSGGEGRIFLFRREGHNWVASGYEPLLGSYVSHSMRAMTLPNQWLERTPPSVTPPAERLAGVVPPCGYAAQPHRWVHDVVTGRIGLASRSGGLDAEREASCPAPGEGRRLAGH